MKKGILIFVIIAVIAIGIVCGSFMSEKEKQNIQTNTNNIEENEIINIEESNYVNELKENIEQNVMEENVENNISSEIFEEEAKTEEEKAVAIVKKDYVTNENVKFSVEGMDANGRQVVVVRNATTTEALAFYFVNVSDKTFTKKEMN